MPTIWMNGALTDEAEARVSVRDFGLLHAAGVFTTMRADAGKVFGLDRHLTRIRHSCDAFSIPLGYSDAQLGAAIDELLADNDLSEARLRLTVTRGEQFVDPIHGPTVRPTVFIAATQLEPYAADLYAQGMTVLAYDEFKVNPFDPQAGHKTLNYLSRLSALREAQRRGANEAILFNVHNYLQSGAISNVFLVKEGRLLTPPTNEELRDPVVRSRVPYTRSNVLPGVVRAAVIEAAQAAGMNVDLGPLSVNDLLGADEVFLTNSAMRVMPVCRIERKPVRDERPGPVTTSLMAAIDERSRS